LPSTRAANTSADADAPTRLTQRQHLFCVSCLGCAWFWPVQRMRMLSLVSGSRAGFVSGSSRFLQRVQICDARSGVPTAPEPTYGQSRARRLPRPSLRAGTCHPTALLYFIGSERFAAISTFTEVVARQNGQPHLWCDARPPMLAELKITLQGKLASLKRFPYP